jgi:hypothetical protein
MQSTNQHLLIPNQLGRSRCFTLWQEFRKCYAQAECPEDCEPQLEDYNECLTHKKEVSTCCYRHFK